MPAAFEDAPNAGQPILDAQAAAEEASLEVAGAGPARSSLPRLVREARTAGGGRPMRRGLVRGRRPTRRRMPTPDRRAAVGRGPRRRSRSPRGRSRRSIRPPATRSSSLPRSTARGSSGPSPGRRSSAWPSPTAAGELLAVGVAPGVPAARPGRGAAADARRRAAGRRRDGGHDRGRRARLGRATRRRVAAGRRPPAARRGRLRARASPPPRTLAPRRLPGRRVSASRGPARRT